jgi:hypothetical protein
MYSHRTPRYQVALVPNECDVCRPSAPAVLMLRLSGAACAAFVLCYPIHVQCKVPRRLILQRSDLIADGGEVHDTLRDDTVCPVCPVCPLSPMCPVWEDTVGAPRCFPALCWAGGLAGSCTPCARRHTGDLTVEKGETYGVNKIIHCTSYFTQYKIQYIQVHTAHKPQLSVLSVLLVGSVVGLLYHVCRISPCRRTPRGIR